MPKIIPVDTFDCIVFGATGDLTLRKLLPALYYRFRDAQIPDGAPRVFAGDEIVVEQEEIERVRRSDAPSGGRGQPVQRHGFGPVERLHARRMAVVPSAGSGDGDHGDRRQRRHKPVWLVF